MQAQGALKSVPVDILVTEWPMAGQVGEAMLQSLAATQKPVFLYSDHPLVSIPLFLNRTGVKAVIPKQNRPELIEWISRKKGAFLHTDARERDIPKPDKNILLILDSATTRYFIRGEIERQNLHWGIREAGDEKQAYSEIMYQAADVVVWDMDMTDNPREVFFQSLRRQAAWRHRPVVGLSDDNPKELREKLNHDPYLLLLPKPVTPLEVVDTLRSILVEKRPIGGRL